jgi:hypothetical protein
MKSGRELDALVAAKVMGLNVRQEKPLPVYIGDCYADGIVRSPISIGDCRADGIVRSPISIGDCRADGVVNRHVYIGEDAPNVSLPQYSTDPTTALEVEEKILSYLPEVREIYRTEIVAKGDKRNQWSRDPHDICLAALKAVGVEL